ncbi:hypothetical protein P171DRAFT_430748 [Karstenula rhodostoma CBS 690.94]|uniref:Leucine-rich repeat domain-containing protein n=1 Tax=Karstenula rhodostoma CBS 690.94 TaxID=1392251 RepID=A0A9P4PPI4_9PLEO|nr:hypothetical protein P171DRAFT_430748 [Karstenula rhodostoma CBS 690.94]
MAIRSENPDSSPKLSELPGELILEILQYLAVTRGYLPPEEEASRQTENAQRITALHGLSLTCRRLNDIVTPYLYESITKLGRSTNWSNVGSLLDTIKRKPKLLQFIRYIETDGAEFDEKLGPSLETKLRGLASINYDFYTGHTMQETYFPCALVVSTLIRLAQNLQSLAIEAMWHREAIYDLYSNLALRDVSLRNTDGDGSIIHISGSSATRFSPAVMLLSNVGQVEAGGEWLKDPGTYDGPHDHSICCHNQAPGDFKGSPVHLEELQSVAVERLALEGNIRDIDLEDLLGGCTFLRQLRCRWTSGSRTRFVGGAIDLEELRKSLRPFEHTLESLVLDTLDSSWLVELDQVIPTIGSLREFTNLKHIEVSGMVLWDDDEDLTVKQPRLSSILPSALETLVVNVEWDDDVEEALVDLATDRATHFPSLKKIDCSWRPAPMFVGRDLIAEFGRLGVQLKLDIASCTEDEEKRIEADMIRMEQEIEFMDQRAEAVAAEMRHFDAEMSRFGMTRIEEDDYASDATDGLVEGYF